MAFLAPNLAFCFLPSYCIFFLVIEIFFFRAASIESSLLTDFFASSALLRAEEAFDVCSAFLEPFATFSSRVASLWAFVCFVAAADFLAWCFLRTCLVFRMPFLISAFLSYDLRLAFTCSFFSFVAPALARSLFAISPLRTATTFLRP